ncbi:MAG: glycosyltransferase family 4 protein, partial [Candidatus Eremiobacteraeota bacterium]|nr:glycosyltransferase family 4 protein [Candidatus Eremiobacteraeota bacterium]
AVPGRVYARWYFAGLQRTLVTQADRIAADSQTARTELLQHVRFQPDRVLVTGAGVDESYFSIERNIAQTPYLLNVGTVEQRKNLAAALPLLVEHPDLILVSAGPHTTYARDVQQAARALGVENRLRLLGYVSPEALLALYAGALAFVFPSTYEGFGLPPLQALAAGLPVIAADIAVLREVLDSCAWFAAPSDGDALARALREIRRGGTAVESRVSTGRTWARGFGWPAVAERMMRLYRSVA